ncbi:MAG TPA: hypothetical protein VLQ48_13615 [Chloroflexia bacterium]|nr:hypothetical protein [Chloroflexia bacterium]
MGPDRGRNTPARLRTALARRLHELAQRLEQSQDSAGTVDDAIPTTHNPQPTSQVTTQNSELGAPPAHWLRDVQARSGTGPPAHWVDYSHGEPLRVDPFDPSTPFLPSVEQDTPPEAGGPKAAGAKRSIGKLLAIKPRVESHPAPAPATLSSLPQHPPASPRTSGSSGTKGPLPSSRTSRVRTVDDSPKPKPRVVTSSAEASAIRTVAGEQDPRKGTARTIPLPGNARHSAPGRSQPTLQGGEAPTRTKSVPRPGGASRPSPYRVPSAGNVTLMPASAPPVRHVVHKPDRPKASTPDEVVKKIHANNRPLLTRESPLKARSLNAAPRMDRQAQTGAHRFVPFDQANAAGDMSLDGTTMENRWPTLPPTGAGDIARQEDGDGRAAWREQERLRRLSREQREL